MCGINGIYHFGNRDKQVEQSQLESMNHLIASRGPDDEGIWLNVPKNLGFAHRRLSIIDLSTAGKQPMTSNCGRYVITFNGEIYNFKELKSSLKERQFISETDTEVVLNLYKEQGISFLNSLRGMFAFGIWDNHKEELLIARDRVGQKPLYYTKKGDSFVFSSGLKSILSLAWIEKQLDESALYDFLTYNHVAAPNTMFQGINKLEPGNYLRINKTGIIEHKAYWSPSFNRFDWKEYKTEDSLCEELRNRIENSVNYRMISDVPVGAFLSGGVDSSAMVAYMQKMSNQAIKTYSIGFQDQADYDELAHANKVAKKFGTEHFEKIVSVQDFKEFLPQVVDIFDEPLADTTAIPIYFLSQLAHENNTKVIMTGDGADELFGGYSNWKRYDGLSPFFSAYKQLPKPIKISASFFANQTLKDSPYFEMFKRAELNQDFFWSGARGFKESNKKQFLTQSFNERTKSADSYLQIIQLKEEFNKLRGNEKLDFMSWLSFTGFKDIIPNLFMYRLDRLTMAHSVEGRSPFMDHDIIDLALALPKQFKIKNGEAKYLLKKALEPVLDSSILYRKKMGFCVPIKEWGTEIMLEHLEEEIDICTINFDIFRASSIREMINSNKAGNKANTNNLWSVFFLNQWLKKWMD